MIVEPLGDEEVAKLFLIAFGEAVDHIFGPDLFAVNYELSLPELKKAVANIGIDDFLFNQFVLLGILQIVSGLGADKIDQNVLAAEDKTDKTSPVTEDKPKTTAKEKSGFEQTKRQSAAAMAIARLRKNHKKVPQSLKVEAGY